MRLNSMAGSCSAVGMFTRNTGKHFRISDDDWLAAEEAGEVTAVFHSHPMNSPVLSGSDRKCQVASGLPWVLACNGKIRTFRPLDYLLGGGSSTE